MKNYYTRYRQTIDQALAGLEVTDANGAPLNQDAGIAEVCVISEKVRDAGGKQVLCGNGASAAFASHMALDWTKNGRVPTMAFSDPALLTAMGNDLGYEEVFSAPLGWHGQQGDLLVTISSSGNSPNILRVIEKAREIGMGVVTLSGLKPNNASRKTGDLNFYIPAKTYGIVECAHQVLLHIWLDHFMGITEWDRDDCQDMSRNHF